MMPSVVNVRTESRRQTRDLSHFFGNDLFDRPEAQLTRGAGSGFIIDDDGVILTNDHVVMGATKITVALYGDERGVEYDARVIGRDPVTDSALIQLTDKPKRAMRPARLGSSKDVQPGDWVMAIGNPFNLAHTVTVGVISAIARPFPVSEERWQKVLQTDAAINPGNSGGPLVNMRGEVVGINNAIMSNGFVSANVGIGFAIPIDTVRELLPELRSGTITRGRIGVHVSPVTKELVRPLGMNDTNGALVRQVERDGAAAKAGIEPGDVIVHYGAQAVEDSEGLVGMVTRSTPGTDVPVEIMRDGHRQTLRVTVGSLERDDNPPEVGMATETGFGLSLRSLTPQMRTQMGVPAGRDGPVVSDVQRGGAAYRAGVRAGDVVLEVNRAEVNGAANAAAALQMVPQDGTALVLLWRGRQEVFLTITR
jgi:serine protease Do